MKNKQIKNNRFKNRKSPRQSRAMTTVSYIKQAALEIILSEGYEAANTTSIANRAGVSVGSLYQYFHAKEAIYLSLFEDSSLQMVDVMKSVMVSMLDQPQEKGLRMVIQQLLEQFRVHKTVLIDMVERVPELKLAKQPLSFENMIYDSTLIYINKHSPGLNRRELERRAYLSQHILVGCVRHYLMETPEGITDNQLTADLIRILSPYLSTKNKQVCG